MCDFLSAIVMRNGDLLCDPENTDSHEDLILANGLKDDGSPMAANGFVRVEFLPPEDRERWADPSTWTLRLDESDPPAWYDPAAVRVLLETRVQRMIVTDYRPILLGGCWIVLGKARISKVLNSRVIYAGGSARFDRVDGSARFDEVGGSARFDEVGGSARFGWVGGSARFGEVGGSARFGWVGGSARFDRVDGSARFDEVDISARFDRVGGSAWFGEVGGSARFDRVGGWARFDRVGGSARFDRVSDTVIIKTDNRKKE